MPFKVQLIDKEDFWDTYLMWCKDRDFPPLHKDNVGEVFICRKRNTIMYSCFVWETNSKMCMLGFPLGNPYVDREFRQGGLAYLISTVSDRMRHRGYTKVWTTSNTWSVMLALEECNFIKADPNVHVYIKML